MHRRTAEETSWSKSPSRPTRTVILTFQLTEAPIVFDRLNFIKVPFVNVFDPHELQIVRPAQEKFSARADCWKILELGKRCFPNLIMRIDGVESPHEFQILSGIALSKPACQICRKLLQKLLAIGGELSCIFSLQQENCAY